MASVFTGAIFRFSFQFPAKLSLLQCRLPAAQP
jgi:hypothetical protein